MRTRSILFCLSLLVSVLYSQDIRDDQGNIITLTSTPEYADNQIIVRFIPNTIVPPISSDPLTLQEVGYSLPQDVFELLSNTGAATIKKVFANSIMSDTTNGNPDLTQFFLVSFSQSIDVESMLYTYNESPSVSLAQPNFIYHTQGNPGDPLFSTQWGLENSNNTDIDALIAWRISTGSSNIKVGVFDTGIDFTHDDLGNTYGGSSKVAGGYNYFNNSAAPLDDRFHGTHVAGIIGAMTNNYKNSVLTGVAGVAGGWGYNASFGSGNMGAKLYAYKVGNESGNIYASEIARAIVEASSPTGFNVDVLNLSYGALNWYDEIDRLALAYAAKRNKVIVASKGNDNTNTSHFPSDYDKNWVLSVGAMNIDAVRATSSNSFGWYGGQGSNYGNAMDLMAPGTQIKSTTPVQQNSKMTPLGIAAGYHSLTGTSFAAPFVSGVAALMLSVDPTLHSEDVQGILNATAVDTKDPGYDEETGNGRLNAGRALRALQDPNAIKRFAETGGAVVGNSESYMSGIWNIASNGWEFLGYYPVIRYDVRKQVTFDQAYPAKPYVWGRGVNASTGLSGRSPIYKSGYCNVTSVSSTGVELQAYVYKVFSEDGQSWVWYPVSPASVQFSFTVLHPNIPPAPPGDVAVVNNSGFVNITWTHNGEGVIYYQIERKVGSGEWDIAGTTQSTSYTDNATRLNGGSTVIFYRVKSIGLNSLKSVNSNEVQVQGTFTSPEKIGIHEPLLKDELMQNHPNPFNPSTQIVFGITKPEFVSIKIYNMLGQQVASLGDKVFTEGYHTIVWNAVNVPSGVYLYEIESARFKEQRKMVIMK